MCTVQKTPKLGLTQNLPQSSAGHKNSDVTYDVGITAVDCWCLASSVTEYQLRDSTAALSTCTILRHCQLQDSENGAFVTFIRLQL